MKVLIISTLYSGGGAEIQSKFEFDLLKRNNINVRYLTFDPNIKTGESLTEGHINLFGGYSCNYRRVSDIFRNYNIEKKLINYITVYKPSIIHLHQVGFAMKSIYFVLREMPCIQTIHDYSIICDKGTCILLSGIQCEKGESSKCLEYCFSGSLKNKIKYYYRKSLRRSIDKYRRSCVDKYISPSECLTKYLLAKKYDAICINNAIDTSEFAAYKKKDMSGKRIILYYGGIRKSKGTKLIIDAFEPKEMPNLEIHFIGGFDKGRREDCYDETEFMKLVHEKNIFFHGKKEHDEVLDFLSRVFAVLVPSFWMENYPTTAIEGIYSRCVVCGSNRGGVPELVCDRKLLFDVMDTKELKKCLLELNNMTDDEYERICNKQMCMFKKNNMPDIYFEKIINVFKEISVTGVKIK